VCVCVSVYVVICERTTSYELSRSEKFTCNAWINSISCESKLTRLCSVCVCVQKISRVIFFSPLIEGVFVCLLIFGRFIKKDSFLERLRNKEKPPNDLFPLHIID
jgi:hypothetical protein